jgi:hypothetical protein
VCQLQPQLALGLLIAPLLPQKIAQIKMYVGLRWGSRGGRLQFRDRFVLMALPVKGFGNQYM